MPFPEETGVNVSCGKEHSLMHSRVIHKSTKDAVSGTGGDVSATGNVQEMSWAPVPWLPGFKSVCGQPNKAVRASEGKY